MLTCQQLTHLVTDYLEGRMSFVERVEFQLHLGLCRHCRGYMGQMRSSIVALGALPRTKLSDAQEAELTQVFRDVAAARK